MISVAGAPPLPAVGSQQIMVYQKPRHQPPSISGHLQPWAWYTAHLRTRGKKEEEEEEDDDDGE